MFEHEETKYELLASSNVLICVRRGVFPWFGISERKLIKTVRQDFIADFMWEILFKLNLDDLDRI